MEGGHHALPTTFVVRASVILRHGPALPPGVDAFALYSAPHLSVVYERREQEIIDERRVTGAPGGGWDRFTPPGVVKVQSKLKWVLPAEAFDHDHRVVLLTGGTVDQFESRVRSAIRQAMAAFEMCTDSHVQVWGSESNSGVWIDDLGNEYTAAYGCAELENHPVTCLDQSDRDRFERLFGTLSSSKNERLLAAYAVARLNTDHLAPAARIVFGWALLERLAKSIRRGNALSHHEVLKLVLQVCEAAHQDDSRPSMDYERLKAAVKRAYKLRNGLAHGESDVIERMDFPALSRAATLMARRLSARVA
jgi:hypothetical protein